MSKYFFWIFKSQLKRKLRWVHWINRKSPLQLQIRAYNPRRCFLVDSWWSQGSEFLLPHCQKIYFGSFFKKNPEAKAPPVHPQWPSKLHHLPCLSFGLQQGDKYPQLLSRAFASLRALTMPWLQENWNPKSTLPLPGIWTSLCALEVIHVHYWPRRVWTLMEGSHRKTVTSVQCLQRCTRVLQEYKPAFQRQSGFL